MAAGSSPVAEGFIEHLFSLLTRDALLIEQIEQVRHAAGASEYSAR